MEVEDTRKLNELEENYIKEIEIYEKVQKDAKSAWVSLEEKIKELKNQHKEEIDAKKKIVYEQYKKVMNSRRKIEFFLQSKKFDKAEKFSNVSSVKIEYDLLYSTNDALEFAISQKKFIRLDVKEFEKFALENRVSEILNFIKFDRKTVFSIKYKHSSEKSYEKIKKLNIDISDIIESM